MLRPVELEVGRQLRLLAERIDEPHMATLFGADPTTTPARVRWGLLWTLVGFLVLLLEGIAVGSKAPGDTLSESMRDVVRFDLIGRFVLVPVWSFLTYHWILRPQHMLGISWRDFVAVGIGLAYAAWETWR